MVRGRLTCIERDISSLEEKETLTLSEQRKIKHLKNQVKEHDQEFEKRHKNRVSDLIEKLEKLEDLVATSEPMRPHTLRIIGKLPADR